MRNDNLPPADPDTSEADEEQLRRAHVEGDAYRSSLDHMVRHVAKSGGLTRSGDYLIGYAVEDAEGMYRFDDGDLQWQNPVDENVHLEIAVCDATDGRFVPAVRVSATFVDVDGREYGPYPQELVWHPMLYHYARNWTLPADGEYHLRVHVEPPTFMRHDEVNGRRFAEPADVEFAPVRIVRGSERVPTPPVWHGRS